MPSSPEKIAANRRNAAKSTGPKTPEGKAASRRNACKHGMAGEGVVLPDEDAAEVEARFAAFEFDLKPANDVARFLARRAAMLSVRMERSARIEAAEAAPRMAAALGVEDEARRAGLAAAIADLDVDAGRAVRELGRSPEGIDWLVAAWIRLRVDLFDPRPHAWTAGQTLRLGRLLGRNCQPEVPNLTEEKQARIAAQIDDQLALLAEARSALDLDAIARVRSLAPARAIFDPSREAELARKYEAAAERGFHKALRDIERINAREAEADRTDSEEETSAELASSEQGPEPTPDEPETGPAAPPKRPGPPASAPAPASDRIPVIHFAEPATYSPPIRE